ncbi:MAG: TerB N-terminal domain-containing protein [Bacteroidales bacterium]|nr:TerB N-terminal domain-containing protein [Bacteroidales bacterium]
MELADLTAYTKEKYNIPEEHKWSSFPGFSVLCHPITKKWLALLMRQWDTQRGEYIEKCDLRCGSKVAKKLDYDFITEPTREKGNDWIGINFDSRTNKQIVLALLDYAYQINTPTVRNDYQLTLDNHLPNNQKIFTDTPINFGNRAPLPTSNDNATPRKIREMQQMYEYNTTSDFDYNKRLNFYRQGKFMEDYTDEVSWTTGFTHYFPTYHDMNVKELREYFAWRTKYRKGVVEQTSKSFAYVYIYELINQIGTKSAQESIEMLEQFYNNYITAGYGDGPMKKNVSQWIIDFCIINDLSSATACKYLNPKDLEQDLALATLENNDNVDTDVFLAAWATIVKKKILNASITKRVGKKYADLYAVILHYLLKSISPSIIGRRASHKTTLLKNAIYYNAGDCTERIYQLNPTRRYIYTGEIWYEECFLILPHQKIQIKNVATAIEFKLKEYFQLTKPTDKQPATNIYNTYMDIAIKEYQQSLRPKIEVDLSSLSQIREDSATTRDSLLTDEDRDCNSTTPDAPTVETHDTESHAVKTPTVETHGRASLQSHPDPIETQILRALISTGDASAIIKANHLMPSVVAEQINEMYYDQFADNIVDCDGSKIWVVEDYREELAGKH